MILQKQKFFINEFKILFLLISALLIIGFVGQFCAAGGEFNKQMHKHVFRMIFSIIIMFSIYMCDFKIWNSFAYLFYAISLLLLIFVEIIGTIKLGAQRWINLYFFSFQPSELMKISLIFALSKYYSMLSVFEKNDLKKHLPPMLLILFPTILILKQPDLGTAMLLMITGIGMIFLAGFPIKYIFRGFVAFLMACPLIWMMLHDYQKNRILTFLNPDKDPFGIGYHILQSKIALGSGGIIGKGFLNGTQSRLNFLPEKNTDFIFTTIGEEFGFLGAISIICIFLLLIYCFFWIGYEVKSTFSKYLCDGIGILLFLHVFINISMVIGLVPVVGIPLPFLSYGGSSMVTFMICCGLCMSALANRKK